MTAEQQSSRKLSYAAIPIAIIGMACRVPKANSPQEFWENLVQGRDCLTFLNDHPTSTNERGLDGHLVPRGGFLERDVAEIDLRSATHYFFLLRDGGKQDMARGKET